MDDPGDHPPPGREGPRPRMYGPFRRPTTYADHGDSEETRREEGNDAARVGASGDNPAEEVGPAIGVDLLNAAAPLNRHRRMSVVRIQIESDESIVTNEPTGEETGESSRVRNIFRRCCNADTTSMEGASPSMESDNPSVRTLNGEILTDLQSVDDDDLNEVEARTSELKATPSGDETSTRDAVVTEETTPKDVDVPNDVREQQGKLDKKSKIRRMVSAVLCKKQARGHGTDAEKAEITDTPEPSNVQVKSTTSQDDRPKVQSSIEKLDSEESKKKGKKSKVFRLFKRKSRGKSKVSRNNKVHPEDSVQSAVDHADSSMETETTNAILDPRVCAAQTEIGQNIDIAETPAIIEKPKWRHYVKIVFLHFICLGSALNEIKTEEEY